MLLPGQTDKPAVKVYSSRRPHATQHAYAFPKELFWFLINHKFPTKNRPFAKDGLTSSW
jgi:hypothetical protein